MVSQTPVFSRAKMDALPRRKLYSVSRQISPMAAARAEVDETCPSVLDASRPGGLTSTEQLTCLSDAGAGLERLARSRQRQQTHTRRR